MKGGAGLYTLWMWACHCLMRGGAGLYRLWVWACHRLMRGGAGLYRLWMWACHRLSVTADCFVEACHGLSSGCGPVTV